MFQVFLRSLSVLPQHAPPADFFLIPLYNCEGQIHFHALSVSVQQGLTPCRNYECLKNVLH